MFDEKQPTAADITLIIDESGSMAPLKRDTIGGINTFIAEQQTMADDSIMSVVTFN